MEAEFTNCCTEDTLILIKGIFGHMFLLEELFGDRGNRYTRI